MKLTLEELDLIDAYLVNKGIKYLDIKLEMIDHIASEIEEKMDQEGISFNDALILVMKNWQHQFNDSRSFWTGIAITYPKIVLDNMLLNAKITGIYSFIFMSIALVFYGILQDTLNEVLQPFSVAIKSVTFLVLTLIVSLIFLVNLNKQKTTFSFFINHSAAMIPMGFMVFLLDEEVVQFQFFILFILSFQLIFTLKNYYLHRKFIKKHHLA